MPEEVEQTLVERLRTRARIRRSISTRKSVQEGKPDRIADLMEEAANVLEQKEIELDSVYQMMAYYG